MMLNSAKLDKLMDEGRWEEAKALLDEYVRALPEDEARAAAHVRLASVYLKVMNRLNADYLATLDDAIAALKKLDARERTLKDETALESARAKLRSIGSDENKPATNDRT